LTPPDLVDAMQLSAQRLGADCARAASAGAPTRRPTAPPAAALAARPSARPQQPARRAAARAAPPRRAAAAAAAARAADKGPGKLISKVAIPAFIPRQDIMDQLYRWVIIEIQEGGMASVGCPCRVERLPRGFTVSFLKDGASGSDIRVAFDDGSVDRHEYIGVGSDGFPTLEGAVEEVDGDALEVRKVDDAVVTEAMRASIREFCGMLVGAINKYYAFGSCFVDDAQ
jgi:hypothetical protein